MTSPAERRAARLVVWLVLLSMVPAGAGFAVAVKNKNALAAVAVWATVVAADVLMMVGIRRKRRSDETPRSSQASESPPPGLGVRVASALGVLGVAGYTALELAELGSETVRLTVAAFATSLVILAGILSVQRFNS